MSMRAHQLLEWVKTQPVFTRNYGYRRLPGGGFIIFDKRNVVAVSPPNMDLVDAIAFWRVIELLIPTGWVGDLKVKILLGNRLFVAGIADLTTKVEKRKVKV